MPIIPLRVHSHWSLLAGVPSLEEIVADAQRDNYSFSSLVLGVTKSVPFRMRAAPEGAGE